MANTTPHPDSPASGPAHPPASGGFRAAIAVNAVLLAALALVTLQPAATAQPAPASERPRGQYLLVGGDLATGSSNAVWITDTVNQELLAVRWDTSRNRLQGLGYRNLRSDVGRQEQPNR